MTSKEGTIFLVPHTHYDAIWVFNKQDYFYINIDLILRKVVELLNKNKEYKFIIEQTYLLKEVETRYPELFKKIEFYIKKGRIEIADGEYLMADTMLPNGETLIREILYGKQYVKEKFGVDVPVMWQADSFGLNAQLPQIYRKCAYKYLIFRRGCPEKKPADFIWKGLDGTEIISHFMLLGYRAGMHLDQLGNSYKTLKDVAFTSNIFMPSGSGSTPPQQETAQIVEEWNNSHHVKIKIATPSEYFEEIEKVAGQLPVRTGEMYSGKYERVFPDVASSRIWLKKSLRVYERQLLSFEKFSTINSILDNPYYLGQLKSCWEIIMLFAFHDVIPGTGMDSGYDDVKQQIGYLRTQLSYLTPRILQSILENTTPKKVNADIAVFNPLSWDVSNWVEVDLNFKQGQLREIKCLRCGNEIADTEIIKYAKYEDGSFERVTIGFTAYVPALGYKVYRICNRPKHKKISPLKFEGNSIENKFFKLNFNIHNGTVEIIKDGKKICKGNELVLEEEVGDLYYHKKTMESPVKTESGEGINYGLFKTQNFWIDESPLRIILHIDIDYYSMQWPYRFMDKLPPLIWRHRFIKFKKEIIVYRDIPRVDFITRVDNTHPRIRLRIKFDTDIENQKYTCESQFGAVDRRTNQYYFRPQGWVEQPPGVFPSLNWIDYSDEEKGLTIINKGTPENEVRDGSMYLTLLRVIDVLSSDGMAGPTIPVPDAREFKTYNYEYSIVPHKKGWQEAQSYKHGHEVNNDLIAIQVHRNKKYQREWAFLKAEPNNIIVSAVKLAENTISRQSQNNKEIIVRLYEAAGKATRATLSFFKPPLSVQVVNMLEESTDEFDKELSIEDNLIKMDVTPFEIITLKLKF